MNPRVKSVKPLCDYQLLLEFTNDEVGIYDCKSLLDFGVFKELQELNYFNEVHIVGDTVAWTNEQDICPDTLYLGSMMVDEITAIWYETIADVNNDVDCCSSEATLIFLFGQRLKNKFKTRITKIELEYAIYDIKVWGKNSRLDFYIELDSQKIGFEFKFLNENSDTTIRRIEIIKDIKRLCELKETKEIDKGYFLLATNKTKSFFNEGKKVDDFKTYEGSCYKQNTKLPSSLDYKNNKVPPIKKKRFEIIKESSPEIIKVPRDICFNWNGIKKIADNKYKLLKKDGYAWLTPIII
jgi:hypothetical protein